MAEEPAVSSEAFDITIIGAGPAGATLARLLSDRYRVLLVDRRNLGSLDEEPRFRKPCGGLVAPDAQAMLARMGLGLPEHVLTGPQLFVVRTVDLNARVERHYQRFYFNIDRERFDRWLVSLVPVTVESRFSTELLAVGRNGKTWNISLREGAGVQEVQTRILVGADGARSKVRSLLNPAWSRPPREYIAVQEWCEAQALPHYSVAFDSDFTDFYAWTIPKGNAVLLGMALLPGADARERFDAMKARMAEQRFAFGRVLRREAHPILRPRLFMGRPRTTDDLMLIGEAGGFISPSSAEGFSYSFKSSLAAAETLNASLERAGHRFQRAIVGLRTQLDLKNLKSPLMYQPFLRRIIMTSGIHHLPMVLR